MWSGEALERERDGVVRLQRKKGTKVEWCVCGMVDL